MGKNERCRNGCTNPIGSPEAERKAPVSMPVERGDDAGGARERKPEEPAREKSIEFELELEL